MPSFSDADSSNFKFEDEVPRIKPIPPSAPATALLAINPVVSPSVKTPSVSA